MPVDLTVWAHDAADTEVYVDPNLIPGAKEGDFAELWVSPSERGRQPRSSSGSIPSRGRSRGNSSTQGSTRGSAREGPKDSTQCTHRRNLYFIIRKPSKPANAISVNPHVLNRLGIRPRSSVRVKLHSSEAAKQNATLDVVEIHFSGVYLTRHDHYQIAKAISGGCVSSGQKLSYLADSVRLTVENLFRRGKHKFSGYVGEDTRIVFRSDSARILIFVQMSKEMYNFDETGDIMFHKLVNSFIPEMLHQWHDQGDSHLVSIVLFTSVRVRAKRGGRRLQAGELEPKTLHFYRVVVDSAHISRWSDIMGALRAEFARFMAEVLVDPDTMELRGTFLPSSKSNLLEAFSLATTLLTSKFIDRDLCHTGVQAMVVTAGPACFDVDLSELWLLSRRLLGVEIGIELVCLARPPLHITPLFRAKLGSHTALSSTSRLVFCVPTWINMSFWTSPGRYRKQWIPRCKIYDLQMVGILENEPRTLGLHSFQFEPNDLTPQFMRKFDSTVFRSVQAIETQKRVESVAISAKSEKLRPQSTRVDPPTVDVERKDATAHIAGPSLTAMDSLGALLKRKGSKMSLRLTEGSGGSGTASTLNTSSRRETTAHTAPISVAESKASKSNIAASNISAGRNTVATNLAASSKAAITHRTLPTKTPSTRAGSSSSIPINNPLRPQKSRISASPLKDRLLAPSALNSSSSPISCEVPLPEYQHSAMWRVLPNSATVDEPSRLVAYGRWANVYPPQLKHNGVSWHSLKSPASLPLTNEGFPSLKSFQEHYQFQFYDIAVDDNDTMPLPLLLDQMIGLRLHMGFQIAVGPNVRAVEAALPRGNPNRVSTVVPTNANDCLGLRVYLTRVGLVHRLAVDDPGTVNLRLYTWIDRNVDRLRSPGPPTENIVKVKTKHDERYHKINQKFLEPEISSLNWSMLDLQVSGADDPLLYPSSANTQNLVSIRFVVLPSETSMVHGHSTLSVEEGHVEGITRIVRAMLKRREAGAIDSDFFPRYYTGKLRHAINEYISTKGNSPLESNRLNKQISLEDLAVELQGSMGLEFKDRRWHWKHFHNVFIGHDLVVWLIKTFEDIHTMEDAEAYGAELMKQGLFKHPENRHPFLHGHYFYEITPQYRIDPADTSTSTSNTSQKNRIVSQNSTSSNGNNSSTNNGNSGGDSNGNSSGPNQTTSNITSNGPTNGSTNGSSSGFNIGNNDTKSGVTNSTKGKVHISGSFVMNIDPRGISKKPERVKVSIDRTHNPKNSYHILLEWLNTTPRLIDDYFSSLGRMAAPYGLRLVQVPVVDVMSSLEDSPFRSALTLKPDIEIEDADESRWFRHYLLRRSGYILDLYDSKDINTEEYEVLFMWGRLRSSLPQYIHKSGYILVQIDVDGTLKLTPNTLYLSRSVIASVSGSSTAEQDCEAYIQTLSELCQDRVRLETMLYEGRKSASAQSSIQSSPRSTFSNSRASTPRPVPN